MVKILGLEINFSKKAAEPAKSIQQTQPSKPLKSAKPRASLGDSGTGMSGGIITEEYNSQLNGIAGIKVYDEMRKSDGTVRAAMLVTTLPILRAKYFVNPATEDAKDKEIANFVEHALFDWLDLAWDDVIRQALLMIPFGVMVFEKVYGTKEHDGKTYVTLSKLAPRLPKSIIQWELSDKTFGIQQQRQDGQIAEIPGSKLAIFVNEREGDNWWGTSFLRAAYKHWYYKNNFYKIDAIAFERQGVGIPVMHMPDGYTEADEAKAATVMQNLRANELGFLLLPKDYEFEFAKMGAESTRSPDASVNHHNKQILQSVLAQFLELGANNSGGGSRALSQDHSDLFLKAMEALAKSIVSVFNKQIIPELVDMNFNDVSVYPVLDYNGISKVDETAIGNAYSQLVASGALTPTPEDEQYLRAALGLPPRTQDDDPDAEEQADGLDVEDTEDTEEEPTEADKNKVDKGAKEAEIKKPTKEQNKKTDKGVSKKKSTQQQNAHEHSAHHGVKKKRTFASKKNGHTFMSWRPLTFAEGSVDFEGIQNNIDKLESGFTQQAKDLLTVAKDQFMKKLHAAIEQGDASTITDLELDFYKNYKELLRKTMTSAYQVGKVGAADELNIGAPTIPADAVANIDMMADTIATKAMTDIEVKAKAMAAQALKSNTSTLTQVGTIDSALEEAIQKSVDNTSALMVGQNVNDGRNDVFQRNRGLIYALQRSEVLDKSTCDFCLSMDGLVIEADDPDWANTSIFHTDCRGIWVAIMKEEVGSEDIEITGVPDKIGDYFGGTPNDLTQPPRVIGKKDKEKN